MSRSSFEARRHRQRQCLAFRFTFRSMSTLAIRLEDLADATRDIEEHERERLLLRREAEVGAVRHAAVRIVTRATLTGDVHVGEHDLAATRADVAFVRRR